MRHRCCCIFTASSRLPFMFCQQEVKSFTQSTFTFPWIWIWIRIWIRAQNSKEFQATKRKTQFPADVTEKCCVIYSEQESALALPVVRDKLTNMT